MKTTKARPPRQGAGPEDEHTGHGASAAIVRRGADEVAEIADQATADLAAFDEAYRLGFAAGVDVGRAREAAETAADWAVMGDQVRSRAGAPTYAELAARRAAPGGPAYYAAVLRHGGTEYGGAGRPRVPVPAAVLAAARAWAARQEPAQGAAA